MNPTGVTCAEGNLDVQMLSAMSGGTKIHAFSYFGKKVFPSLELLMKALGHLAGQKVIPAVMSISYEALEIGFGTMEEQICTKIGDFSMNYGTMFFTSSGNEGASDTDGCGTYTPLFPATCRYVTTIGGSSGIVAGKEEQSIASTLQGQNIVSVRGYFYQNLSYSKVS